MAKRLGLDLQRPGFDSLLGHLYSSYTAATEDGLAKGEVNMVWRTKVTGELGTQLDTRLCRLPFLEIKPASPWLVTEGP